MAIRQLSYKALARGLSPFTQRAASSVSILMFHGLHDDKAGPLVCGSSRSKSDFRVGIEAIVRRFQIVSMDHVLDLLTGKRVLSEPVVAVTFDDSVQAVLPAARILAEFEVPGMFYLSTAMLEGDKYYWWHRLEYAVHNSRNERVTVKVGEQSFTLSRAKRSLGPIKSALKRLNPTAIDNIVSQIEYGLGSAIADGRFAYPCAEPLNWDDAGELLALGMSIGSHGVSHANVSQLDGDALRRELEDSKDTLEARFSAECRHFSYPYGIMSASARDAVIQAGYKSAVTAGQPLRNKPGADPWSLARMSMHRDAWKVIYQVGGQHELIVRLLPSVRLGRSPQDA